MEVTNNTVRLTEREKVATGLPEEFPLGDAPIYASALTEGYIPALRNIILEMQTDGSQPNQQELTQKYRDHFCASLVARGLERAVARNTPSTP